MTYGYKRLIQNYTFNHTAKTITFTDFVTVRLDCILLITNVTSNVIIYNFADNTLGGTVSSNILTLTYNTSSMNDSDKLEIWYWDDTASLRVDGSAVTQTVSGSITANAGTNLNTSLLALETGGNLAAIKADTDKIPLLGQALAASSVPVTLTALEEGLIGSLTETAPATDTASSGLNGRLQRIAQRLTTVLTGIVLAAGSAIIGKVGIDQTTPGTTNAVSLAQIGANTAVTAGVNGTLAIGGNVATNVAIGTNPVNLGAQGVSSENTAITTSRLAQLVCDLVGKLIVLPYANPENFINGTTAAIIDTTSTSTIAAQASGVRSYITQITVTNSHATVGTFVKILDGSTILHEAYAASAGGGYTATFPTPLRGSTATAVNTQCVTTGANVISSVSGYKGV